jgi:hypothetical protein
VLTSQCFITPSNCKRPLRHRTSSTQPANCEPPPWPTSRLGRSLSGTVRSRCTLCLATMTRTALSATTPTSQMKPPHLPTTAFSAPRRVVMSFTRNVFKGGWSLRRSAPVPAAATFFTAGLLGLQGLLGPAHLNVSTRFTNCPVQHEYQSSGS